MISEVSAKYKFGAWDAPFRSAESEIFRRLYLPQTEVVLAILQYYILN